MLHAQMINSGTQSEIILIDDKSSEQFKVLNQELAGLEGVRYYELEKNIGRSRIRNLLTQKAGHDWLLFLDCDSGIPDSLFVKIYLDQLPCGEVVCGGRSYSEKLPDKKYSLHWWYGRNRETREAKDRIQSPYRSFMTNNFMVPKTVLLKIPFNEQLSGYGHEDTLFGYELMKNKISVKHIDNPLLHIGLDPNSEFLAKSREGVKNLAFVYKNLPVGKDFVSMSKLLAWYTLLLHWGLAGMAAFIFRMLKKPLEKNLLGNNPNLLLFDFYKLGLMVQVENRKH
jgi:glycosyltransferase involved in cell wall biosynthesis